jgi:hypothetical protein
LRVGILEYNNGDRYVGDWKDDAKSGEGVYTYEDTGKYEGGFKNDIKTGFGITLGYV